MAIRIVTRFSRCSSGYLVNLSHDLYPGNTGAYDRDMLIEEVLHRARVTATGGRDVRVLSSDGVLDLKLTTPHELGGANGRGTNPEQLFAAGYTVRGEAGLAVQPVGRT